MSLLSLLPRRYFMYLSQPLHLQLQLWKRYALRAVVSAGVCWQQTTAQDPDDALRSHHGDVAAAGILHETRDEETS